MENNRLKEDGYSNEEDGSLLEEECGVQGEDSSVDIEAQIESENYILDEIDGAKYASKCDAMEVGYEIDGNGMHYKISEVPNAVLCFVFGFQVIFSS